MNATVRASLISTAIIATACWVIPALLVRIAPFDAGMIAMVVLLYALLPIAAIALGLLAASCSRALFWAPATLGVAFALLFPLAVEGSQDIALHGVVYAAIGYAAMGFCTWAKTRARQ